MTATEFLIEYCDRENWSIPNNILEKAKEMEKQQIIDAYETGDKYKSEIPGEQYYNETYKKNGKMTAKQFLRKELGDDLSESLGNKVAELMDRYVKYLIKNKKL